MSFATKYRPREFEDVCSQKSLVQILKNQILQKKYSNAYLFCGPSGCGKTTVARIFASWINGGASPIEMDSASNNGVDNIRLIVEDAMARSLSSEYKIFILDECHAITSQGWQAFLKCLEEPPKYTIFIFCTTEPQKIPSTILNRVQRFNFNKIPLTDIKNRLDFICWNEGLINYNEATDYISKISEGGMRDAISLLEKCASYSNDLTNYLEVLGAYSYDTLFEITNYIIDGRVDLLLQSIEGVDNSGTNIKMFIDNYLNFLLDLTKFCIFNNMEVTKLPSHLEEKLRYTVGIENNQQYFTKLCEEILVLKQQLRYDNSPKLTTQIKLSSLCRGV